MEDNNTLEHNEQVDNVGSTAEDNGFTVDIDAAMQVPEYEKEPEEKSISKEIFEWLDVLVTAMVAVVLIFSLFFRIATIDGRSMLNTLHHGEKVIITNLAYTPKRGDIVVVSRNFSNSLADESVSALPIIKRVIAVGGDTVNIDFERGVVIVNGVELDEPYARTPTTQKKDLDFPMTVPQGYIFVLGDNRADSLDSRSSAIGEDGMINVRFVLGHAFFRVYPFDVIGGL